MILLYYQRINLPYKKQDNMGDKIFQYSSQIYIFLMDIYLHIWRYQGYQKTQVLKGKFEHIF